MRGVNKNDAIEPNHGQTSRVCGAYEIRVERFAAGLKDPNRPRGDKRELGLQELFSSCSVALLSDGQRLLVSDESYEANEAEIT